MVKLKTKFIKPSNLIKLDKNNLSLIILATLAAIQLLLYWRYINNLSQLFIQAIFVIGLFWQVYRKQIKLNPVSDIPSSLLGITIILLCLLRAKYILLVEASVFWYFFSWLTYISYIILVAGLRGLKQFRREIIFSILITLIPLFLAIIYRLADKLYITVISAKFSSFLLWYIGFESSTQGTIIYVNNGAVNVYYGCTGIPLFFQLLNFALLLILLFPSFCRNLWLPFILPVILSLVFSTIRLAVMALVVNDKPTFHYWHGIQGGNIFTGIALITFFGIILLTAPPQKSNDINPISSTESHQSAPWLWIAISITLIIILWNFTFSTNPIAGANRIADYQFPSVINLPGWQFQDSFSQPLIPVVEADQPQPPTAKDISRQIGFNLPLSERSYRYQKEDNLLTVNLRYIINTSGGIKNYYRAFQDLPRPVNSTEVKSQDDYALQFVSNSKKYLTTCLNSEGKTTITDAIFSGYFRQVYSQPTKVLYWLLGKRALQDRRCLWIEISSTSMTTAELITVWQTIIHYWQSHFPPLR
ncbi:MAG: archaeosortase/exosortase family protein [Snowella sp.]|nr:archaeosortase/exosortase family protein [Snowella sp.]